jgi:hypothetical protein
MFTDKFVANYFFIKLSLTYFEEAKDDIFEFRGHFSMS